MDSRVCGEEVKRSREDKYGEDEKASRERMKEEESLSEALDERDQVEFRTHSPS